MCPRIKVSYLQTQRIKNKSKDYTRLAEDFAPFSGFFNFVILGDIQQEL
jgi:hypothetical protein